MLRLPTSPLYRVMAVCLSVAFLAGASARAGTSTFVGGGGNDWWGTTANWDAGGIPNGTDDIAVFSLSANPSYSTNTHPGPPYTVQELVYNTSSTWRMHNNERDINLEGPGGGASTAWVTQNGSGAVTFDCDLRLAGLTTPGGTVTFRGSGTGDMTVNGSILPGSGQRLGIYGTGSLVKEGGYALIVNTVIQHEGSTTVNDGILRLNQSGLPLAGGSNGQFGSAGQTVTVNTGGTLELTRNWVMGGGQQHELVANGGTIAFAGADNYQSKITLTGGHVTTSGGTRPWRTGNFGPGLITVNPSANSSTIDGSLCFVGTAAAPTTTFDVADGAAADDLIMSSHIFDHPGFEGDMVLVKTGPGTLVLAGANTYTGETTVNGGTLELAGNNGWNARGGVYNVNDGGTLKVTNNANQWNVGSNTVVNVNGGGELLWNPLGAYNLSPYLRTVNLDSSSGTAATVASTSATVGPRFGYAADGLITSTGPVANTWTSPVILVNGGGKKLTIDTTADLTMSGLIYDYAGLTGAPVIKTGPGTLRLTNAGNSWDGGLSINGGTVSVPQLTGGNTNGPLGGWYGTSAYFSFDGGTLEYTGPTVGGINRAFTINAGGATIDVANAATTLTWTDTSGAGPITGVGALTKAGPGTLVLAGSNNYAGGTNVTAGTLRMGNAGALGSGAVQIDGATLDIGTYNVANDIVLGAGANTILVNGNYRVLSGQISGPGGFTLGGTGTPGMALSNPANDFQGDVVINGGAYLGVWADEVIPDTAKVTVNGALRLQGANRVETIGEIAGGGDIFAVGANTKLVIASGTYSGAFATHSDWMGLEKAGPGTLTLTAGGAGHRTTGVDVTGGTLRLNVNRGWNQGYFTNQDNVPYTIAAGATLQLDGNYVTRSNSIYNLSGGTILTNASTSDENYANLVTMDVAPSTIGGAGGLRQGYFFDPTYTVRAAASGSEITARSVLVDNGGVTSTFTIDVEDGAQANDLTISGLVHDLGGYAGLRIVKAGAGTLRLTHGGNSWDGGLSINGGTVSVGQLTPGNWAGPLGGWYGTSAYFSFDGGTLEYTGPTVGGINRAFTINAGGATIDVANAATTLTWTDASGAGPITGVGALTKAGPGTLVLAGTHNYAGGTIVREGTLQVGAGGNTGAIAGTVTLGDAATGAADVAFLVNRSDVNTHANPIVVSALGTGTATIGSAGTAGGAYGTIFTGPVTLNRPTTMQGTDPDRTTFTNVISGNVGVLTVTGGARTTWEADNTFVGDVDVQGAGTILQVGSGSGATTQQIPNASNVNLGAGARLYLVFDDETINGLTGSGTVSFYPSGGLGATTLTVGAGGANATFAGSIQNGSPTAMNLIKTGPGTQVLSGANTYTGTTTVADGVLLVNGTHTGGAAYTVTGGALGGTGVISAPLAVQAGAALAPGDGGVGTLGVGSLTLDPGATLLTEITGAGAADLVNVTGTVDLDQAVLRVLFGYEPAEMDSWLILANDGTDAILPDTFAGLPEGATFYAPGASMPLQITYEGGTGNDIGLTAVPEPATLLAAFAGLAGLGGYLRRRRHA